MEAALKTSFRKELSFVKSSSLVDEFLGVGLQNGAAAACEDFSVDELLDFSNEEELFQIANEGEDDDVEEEEEDFEEKAPSKSNGETGVVDASPGEKDEFDPVPADDVASLEWLSHFVDDSNAEYATPFPPGIHFPKEEDEVEKKRFGPGRPEQGTVFMTPVPARARSKRTRTGVRVWSLGAPPSTESSSSSTSSSGSYSSPHQQTGGGWLLRCPVEPVRGRPGPGRKSKKTKRLEGERSGIGAPQLVGGRRCSHCGVQKTPQWRAGPLGAKTLCNACGVRFKSGRLLPEYRPACSPTFSSELHSNSHRKVLEMRKKKEDVVVVGDRVELPNSNPVSLAVGPEVPSFG